MMVNKWTWCWVLLVLSAPVLADDQPGPRQLDSFELQDYRGRTYSLHEFADKQLLVIAFLGTECPLVKFYGPRLQELAGKYQDRGVQVIGINANVQDSMTEIAAYARQQKIAFPILKDVGNQLADQLGAQRTPEVFVLDAQRVVRYAGRIDDQYGIGYVREKPTAKDLERAVDELLSGQPVSQPATAAVGCRIGRVRDVAAQAKTDSEVTYSNQIARILQKHCITCHREGEIAPFALTEYSEVAGWADTITEVIEQGRMPPWHADPKYGEFRNENRLSDDEKSLIVRWTRAGAPEGDPADLPPPVEFTAGWQLPREPDQIIPVTTAPYQVPATGEVRYQYFVVDPGFTEDKWVQAAELQPGNRAVVHHILVFARKGRMDLDEGGVGGFLVGYVPGKRIQPFPEGMAKLIPAGAKLIFQVHYTPIGSPQEDSSRLGLIFADPATITHEVRTTSAVQRALRIPPGDANHRVEATRHPLDECQILGFMPHMHLRGKSILYEALYPSGETETLLDVPHYDFNWQSSYLYKEPKKVPAGTRIHCIAHFDNSENNLNNPDPTQTVRWGDQTWEEMMIGYFDIAVPREAAEQSEGSGARDRALRALERLDKNADGKLVADELPPALQRVFQRIDADSSGEVTEAELAEALKNFRE